MRLISNRTLVIVLLLGHVVLVSSKQEYSSRKLLQESLHSWLKGAHSTIFGSRAKDPDDFIAAAGTPSVNGPDLLGNTKERTFGDGFLIKSHPHMSSFATFDSTPDVLGAGHTQVVDAEAVKDAGRSAAAEIANTAVADAAGEIEASMPDAFPKPSVNCKEITRDYHTCVKKNGKKSRNQKNGQCSDLTMAYQTCAKHNMFIPDSTPVVATSLGCMQVHDAYEICMQGLEKKERYTTCRKQYKGLQNCQKRPDKGKPEATLFETGGGVFDAQKQFAVKV